MDVTESSATLMIRQASEEDAGRYTVTVCNELGADSFEISVSVVGEWVRSWPNIYGFGSGYSRIAANANSSLLPLWPPATAVAEVARFGHGSAQRKMSLH